MHGIIKSKFRISANLRGQREQCNGAKYISQTQGKLEFFGSGDIHDIIIYASILIYLEHLL